MSARAVEHRSRLSWAIGRGDAVNGKEQIFEPDVPGLYAGGQFFFSKLRPRLFLLHQHGVYGVLGEYDVLRFKLVNCFG